METRRVRRRRGCPVRRPLDNAGERGRGRPHRGPPGRRIFFATEVARPEGLSLLRRANPVGELFARARGAPSELEPNPTNRERAASPPTNGNTGQESLGRQRTALAAGEPVLPILTSAYRELFGRDPRFSVRRWGRLLGQALRRCDRYGDFAARAQPPGARAHQLRPGRRIGAELLLDAMEELAERVGQGEARAPHSLAYFVPWLDQVSKDFRRQQRPRLKEARRAETARRGYNNRKAG